MKKQPEEQPETLREKPFTELYESWDKPQFSPDSVYVMPKKIHETTNRTVSSRLYENIIQDFSRIRIDALNKKLKQQPGSNMKSLNEALQDMVNYADHGYGEGPQQI